jgi:hypothetical protein
MQSLTLGALGQFTMRPSAFRPRGKPSLFRGGFVGPPAYFEELRRKQQRYQERISQPLMAFSRPREPRYGF